jgi:hypothetical protein
VHFLRMEKEGKETKTCQRRDAESEGLGLRGAGGLLNSMAKFR